LFFLVYLHMVWKNLHRNEGGTYLIPPERLACVTKSEIFMSCEILRLAIEQQLCEGKTADAPLTQDLTPEVSVTFLSLTISSLSISGTRQRELRFSAVFFKETSRY
jgi:hypothetical protein